MPLHKVIRRYDLPYFRNSHKNEKLLKHYQNMAQREARMQWIFKHTADYEKMRESNPELPRKYSIPFRFSFSIGVGIWLICLDVAYETAQQYQALLDVLVYVGRSAEFDADGSDESDDEHEWYGRL